MPLTNLTVFAWLPSASPSALTNSPDFFKSSSSVVMNLIISTIHSLPIAANPASADPNVMIMYFISSLLGMQSEPPGGSRHPGRPGRADDLPAAFLDRVPMTDQNPSPQRHALGSA